MFKEKYLPEEFEKEVGSYKEDDVSSYNPDKNEKLRHIDDTHRIIEDWLSKVRIKDIPDEELKKNLSYIRDNLPRYEILLGDSDDIHDTSFAKDLAGNFQMVQPLVDKFFDSGKEMYLEAVKPRVKEFKNTISDCLKQEKNGDPNMSHRSVLMDSKNESLNRRSRV